eukprot:6175133-Pleurochrysis_carterae.AAC.1
MDVSFDAFWERGVEFPPLRFKVDKNSAVEFLCAVLDSAVGKRISPFSCLTEAVAAQVGQFFLSAKDLARSTLLRRTPAFRPFMRLFSHQFISSSACQRLAHTH